MRPWHLLFALAGLVCGTTACGGNVVVDGSGSGGSVTTSTSATTCTGPSSGGPQCVGELTVQVDDGATMMLGAACADANPQMATTPVGYELVGGPSPGTTLMISACAAATSDSQGVEVTIPGAAAAGTFTNGTASLLAGGGSWGSAGNTFAVDISNLGPVGSMIVGSFDAVVGLTGATHSIVGSFAVCRTADELVN